MRLLSPAGSPKACWRPSKRRGRRILRRRGFTPGRGLQIFRREMEKALDLCHLYGAKAFITMNTLLTDRELPEAMAYARFLYRAGADA